MHYNCTQTTSDTTAMTAAGGVSITYHEACKVSLPWKQLSSAKAPEISQMIQAVLSPLHVNLVGNDLKDDGAEIVAASAYEYVQELIMSCNSIGVRGALAISSVLSRSSVIQNLSLFGNEIGDDGAAAIAESLRINTSVLVLNLSYNRITCEGAFALAKGIAHHPHLKRVDLSGNEIGDEGASALAAACMRSCSLRDLTLSRNHIGDLGAKSFAKALQRDSCKLHSLRLASNDVGVTGARALALSLRTNTALRTIDMRFSHLLVSAGRRHFLVALQCNTTLSACHVVQRNSDRLQSELDYVTDLNKAGRCIARSKVELLGFALAQVKDQPRLIYGLLKEAPHVWAACCVNK